MHGKHILALLSRLTLFHERATSGRTTYQALRRKVGIVMVSVHSQTAGRRRRLGVDHP